MSFIPIIAEGIAEIGSTIASTTGSNALATTVAGTVASEINNKVKEIGYDATVRLFGKQKVDAALYSFNTGKNDVTNVGFNWLTGSDLNNSSPTQLLNGTSMQINNGGGNNNNNNNGNDNFIDKNPNVSYNVNTNENVSVEEQLKSAFDRFNDMSFFTQTVNMYNGAGGLVFFKFYSGDNSLKNYTMMQNTGSVWATPFNRDLGKYYTFMGKNSPNNKLPIGPYPQLASKGLKYSAMDLASMEHDYWYNNENYRLLGDMIFLTRLRFAMSNGLFIGQELTFANLTIAYFDTVGKWLSSSYSDTTKVLEILNSEFPNQDRVTDISKMAQSLLNPVSDKPKLIGNLIVNNSFNNGVNAPTPDVPIPNIPVSNVPVPNVPVPVLNSSIPNTDIGPPPDTDSFFNRQLYLSLLDEFLTIEVE